MAILEAGAMRDFAEDLMQLRVTALNIMRTALGLGTLVYYRGYAEPPRVPSGEQLTEAQARALGTVEGGWAAYSRQLWEALGLADSPEYFLQMHAGAREAAQRAYDLAYREAMGRVVGTGGGVME